jgi:redox-sensitive bicupin YhaK (pirin superfamily)
MKILKKDNLIQGGFAGIKEHRLIVDKSVGGRSDTFDGIGNLVYLADAYFEPYGQTNMHSHNNIDVITVILEGDVNHEGTLNNNFTLSQNQVQIQKSGEIGFSNNEINPNKQKSHIIQLWMKPQNVKYNSTYELYDLKENELTQVYGEKSNSTNMEVAILSKNKILSKNCEFQMYVTQGSGILNGKTVKEGDLIQDTNLELEVISDIMKIIIISEN